MFNVKVARDRVVEKWKFIEKAVEEDVDYGSGYPSGLMHC